MGTTSVSAPPPDPAAQRAAESNARIAEMQFNRSVENDNWYKQNILPRAMGEMERQAKISQDQYETGKAWATQDRARLDKYYDEAYAYDPEETARKNAERWRGDAVNEFNRNYSNIQNQAVRGLMRSGRSNAMIAPDLIAAAAAKTNASASAIRAGDMASAAARAERLNVRANASGRSNPMAGMGLAMQGAGMGMQGMNFAQGGMGQNSSMFNAGMGSAMQANGSLMNYGLSQQQMQMQAGMANAQATQQLIGAGMGAAAMAFSDRRLKKRIKFIGTRRDGLGLYEFEYVWGGPKHVGVMADEVRRKFPEAVVRFGEYDMVDYSKL